MRELGVGVDGDRAHAGHVEGQATLGDGGAGDVVTAAFDAEQQAVVAREPDAGGDVAGRGRLEDECGDLGHHGVPDQHRIVPALVTRAQQRTLDPRVQLAELFRRQVDASAVKAGDLHGGRDHVATLSSVVRIHDVTVRRDRRPPHRAK